MRDMSHAQFVKALADHGIKHVGFMGYADPVDLGIPDGTTCVSHHNAGENRRAKLAYLLKEQARRMEEKEVRA